METAHPISPAQAPTLRLGTHGAPLRHKTLAVSCWPAIISLLLLAGSTEVGFTTSICKGEFECTNALYETCWILLNAELPGGTFKHGRAINYQ